MKQPTGSVVRSEIHDLLRKFLEEGDEEFFTWESITTKEGLSHNWVYDLFQDSRGRIWVGTWGGGVSMLENNQWKKYSKSDGLHSMAATCIREDKHGEIWVSTDNGLNRFENGRFVSGGLYGKSLLQILFDRKGNLWAGCWRSGISGGGLFKHDGFKWDCFSTVDGLPGLEILKIFEDSRGRIWVGTYEHGTGAGAGCYDGSNWRSYNTTSGLIHNCVYSMFEDPEGNMWFGTVGGLSIYDGKGWRRRIPTFDGLIDNRVYAMLIDSKKKMWFGTEGGVSLYDGVKWKSFTQKDGLIENLVRTILEDRDGNLWFGTYPYAPGKGGITIARRKKESQSLEDRLKEYLPRSLNQKALK
jgi:ligand-binding sensor domain-containing protein